MGTANILKSCVLGKVKKYILASSIYADSSQGGFYRVSKQASELMTAEYGKVFKLKYTILRYGSIYGPRSNLNNGLFKIVYDAVKKKKLFIEVHKEQLGPIFMCLMQQKQAQTFLIINLIKK